MVHLSFHDRLQPQARALAWLVDEAGGEATLQRLSGVVFGPRAMAKTAKYLQFMGQAGWVAVEDGKARYNGDAIVRVTPAGYLWRDYFEMGNPDFNYNRIEDHAFRRAFAMALEPLAQAGKRWREADKLERYRMQIGFENVGISARQALIAAELLFPSGDTHVIYPWTPGYLTRKTQLLTSKKPNRAKPFPR